jgi:hypothetical protein
VVKHTKPEHIKNIINGIISKIKEKEGKNKTGEIGKYITKILGKQSEEHVEVSSFKKGSLYIKVTNSAWLQELSLMKQDLVNSINVELKRDLVKDIKIELVKK